MDEKLKMKSTRSKEILHHFSCQKCRKWWTVGDAPVSKDTWYCPWCGVMSKFKKSHELKRKS